MSLYVPDYAHVYDLARDLPVPSTETKYTLPISVERYEYFSLFIKAEGTSPHLKIVRCYNFSIESPPAEDTWAELKIDGTEDVLIEDYSQSNVWTIVREQPIYSIWLRYKVSGLPANSEDTKISIYLVAQKKDRMALG